MNPKGYSMSLVMTGAPALEPVTLAAAKTHLRVDSALEDVFIASLITTSRVQVEAILGLALITQNWTWRFDAWRLGGVAFPLAPVSAVTSVRTQNSDLSYSILAPAAYIVDGASTPPRLVPSRGNFPSPAVAAIGIEIQFTAGYGALAADVPAPLRQAILLLVAHWFENREPLIEGAMPKSFPDAIIGLLEPYRVRRL